MSNLAPVVDSCHDLLLWLIPQLDKFPRNRRFTLGERLEASLLAVLELLVRAAYTRDKRQPLTEANSRLAVARHLWRLCYELRLVSVRRFEHGAGLIDGVGRQVGGWLRASS